METQRLIDVQPVRKKKGFEPDQLRIEPATAEDRDVRERMLRLKPTRSYTSLTPGRKRVVDLVADSYDRKVAGVMLEPADLVLRGHELVEFDRVSDDDVFRYVFYRYKYDKYPELKTVDDYPPCLQIEPSSVCNLRCVMCYQTDASFSGSHSEHMGYMVLETFKDLVDQAQGNIEAITLASRGEPLLNRHIAEMLEYCRGKFLGLKVNTNASILNEKIIHALLSSDVQTIVFSIDAADKDLYEKIRVKGDVDRLKRNLDLFREIKEKHYGDSRTITRISGVKINKSQGIDEMEAAWSSYADIVAFTNYTPWESSYENQVNDIEDPCTELWRRMFVWQDGVTNPCDYDYKSTLSQWNAADTRLSDIWTSEAYERLRSLHLDHLRSQLEPCRRCISV